MIDESLAAALDRLARHRPLLVATDYDGVLSPLIDDPAAATPDPAALAAFLQVADHHDVRPVVVSGRSRSVLAGFLGDPDGVVLVGSHGAELDVDSPDDTQPADPRVIVDEMSRAAAPHRGAHVESKPHGAAFHYRNADDKDEARRAAIEVAARLPGRTIVGKDVVEVVASDATKGTAVEHLRRETGASAVLYLGDDVTDEDVFATLGDGDVAIKVGPGDTIAPHRVDSPDDVASVFAVLRSALSAGDEHG